jgi:hypothetical protein
VILHTVPSARVRLGVSVKVEAGDELSANLSGRPRGQANLNDLGLARTRSLNRIESTPRADIDTDTTRGALSADLDGTRSVNHAAPPATDTPTPSPSGAASATATTFHQLTRERPLLARPAIDRPMVPLRTKAPLIGIHPPT